MKVRAIFYGIVALAVLANCAFPVGAAAETTGAILEKDAASWVEFAPEWGDPPAQDGFDAELLRQARAARKEGSSVFRREVDSAAEAAELLGVPLLHSELLEKYADPQRQLEVCCRPSLALQSATLDLQYGTGECLFILRATVAWEDGYRCLYDYAIPDAAESFLYTTGAGQEVEVFRLLDEEERPVRMCTVFRHGDAVYQLFAVSDGCSVPDAGGKYRPSDGVPEERFLRVLDSLETAA